MTDVVLHSGLGCHLPRPNEGWRRAVSHRLPLRVKVGDRLYLVHKGELWGYGQICMITEEAPQRTLLGMGAPNQVALNCRVKSFDGFQYRWWDRTAETETLLAQAIREGVATGRTSYAGPARRVLCQDDNGNDVVMFQTAFVGPPMAGSIKCN